MSGILKLYSAIISPPCRFVLMTLKSLGLQAEIVEVDLFKNEHLIPQYVKLNPKHQVPALVDSGLILSDSHAIATYLVNRYDSKPESRLYPREPVARASVDQILCFNMTHLFPANSAAMSYFFKTGIKPESSKELGQNILISYKLLEYFLQKSTWLSGDEITLADLCCLATVSSSELLVPLDDARYPRTVAWLNKCKATKVHQEDNLPGVEELRNKINNWTVTSQ